MSFQDKFKATYSLPPKTAHKNRLKHALLSTGHQPTHDRIETCSKTKPCDSYYCQACRARFSQTQSSKIAKRYRELHGSDDGYARNNMKFLTILHELVPIGHKTGAGGTRGYNDFSPAAKSLTSFKRRLALVRKKFPGLETMGRVEFELVKPGLIVGSSTCPKKSSVMESMIERNGGTDDVMIHVHAHLVVFLNGNNLDEVKAYVRAKWPGKNMVRFDSLHDDKTVTMNIKKISSYLVKDRYQFNNSMKTDGYENGSYFDNYDLSYLVRLLLHLGVKKMQIWSKRRGNLAH